MRRLGLLAPWIDTENLGDEVIRDSVRTQLSTLGLEFFEVPTHRRPRLGELRRAASADTLILGGTNALSGHLERSRQWWLTPDLAMAYRQKVVCLGVGWRDYQDSMSGYSRWALRTMLARDAVHSVRDEYTAQKLRDLGVNAVNTACPTMWDLGAVERAEFDKDAALVTLTNYRDDRSRDVDWLQAVRDRYVNVLLQPMSEADVPIANDVAAKYDFTVLAASLENFNRALDHYRPVYVGTRLHAGIRAFQKGLPGVIIGIDNRAREIARSTSLPIASPSDVEGLTALLDQQTGPGWVQPDATSLHGLDTFELSIAAHR